MLDSAADLMKLDNFPVLKDWSSGSGGDTNECDLQYQVMSYVNIWKICTPL